MPDEPNLYATSFETFERNIREQLARSVGAGGFDPARDIAAITVNRWPHGYAYQYNSLWDPFWLEGGPLPCVEARKPFGRIAIANADADAYAYTDCAINQAYRAVNDLKVTPGNCDGRTAGPSHLRYAPGRGVNISTRCNTHPLIPNRIVILTGT